MTTSYLLHLTERLATGARRLPATERTRHAEFLRSTQTTSGAFTDRHGGPDLYYTAFALRGLAVLDALTPELSTQTAAYLSGCLQQQTTIVDFFSFLYACVLVQAGGGPDVLAGAPGDWPQRVADALESLRTTDGGYGKAPGAASGSTYHSFLVALTYQLLGREQPHPQNLATFVLSRRREDGGFVEIAPMRRGGTNPTAAAVGVLDVLQPVTTPQLHEIRDGVIEFLADMPSLEGGLRANGRAPLSDLLSTFTAAWTLHQLGALDRLEAESVLEYVTAVARPEGGFRGGLWDEGCDAEYTFYGLGTLALFS